MRLIYAYKKSWVSAIYQIARKKEWLKNCSDDKLVTAKSFYQKKKKSAGSKITELNSQKQVLLQNAQSRYSNRTVTLRTFTYNLFRI